MHAMSIDDAYRVERVLADHDGCVTELVTLDGAGPFVRKKMARDQVHRGVWAALTPNTSPHVPQVRATYEMPDLFVVVCDYVPGETLSAFVERNGRLASQAACHLIRMVCEAAGALHARGIVHRDIAPGNIVAADDGAHLIDLGSARLLSEPSPADGVRERAMGTWGFAAPEQYGFAPVDARSDIYSIGCVLGYLVTGLAPDDSGYEAALADELHVSAAVRSVIERACAFEPSARFQTATEFEHALDCACGANADDAALRPGANGDAHSSAAGGASVSGGPSKGAASGAASFRWGVWAAVILAAALLIGILGVIGMGWLGAGADGDDKVPATSQAEDGGDGEGHAPSTPDAAGGLSSGATSGDGADLLAYEEDKVEPPLELVESGWSADSSGFINYAVGVRNASSDERVDFPRFTVTGYGPDGSVIFSQEQVLSSVFPGQTAYFAGIAGNGVVPERVEFVLGEVETYCIVGGINEVEQPFAVDNASAAENAFGLDFAGEISYASEDAYEAVDRLTQIVGVCVSVVLRDEDGAIVGGAQTFVDAPSKDGSVPFSVTGLQLPGFSTYEVWVIPW